MAMLGVRDRRSSLALFMCWYAMVSSFVCTLGADTGSVLQATATNSRQLSNRDGILYPGKLRTFAHRGAKHFLLIHTPKAAGDSFLKDAPRVLPRGSTLVGNGEDCWQGGHGEGQALVMFFRHPLKHVLSQFLHCKHEGRNYMTRWSWQAFDGLYGGLKEWLGNWSGPVIQNLTRSFVLGCYNPWNQQTRHLTSANSFHPFHCNGFDALMQRHPDFDQAARHMDELHFVGMVDLYTESLCLFGFFASSTLPEGCACETHAHFNVTHHAHGVPAHELRDVEDELQKTMAEMVQTDQRIFRLALKRFKWQARYVEDVSGVQVLCPEKIQRLEEDVDTIEEMMAPRSGAPLQPSSSPSVSITRNPPLTRTANVKESCLTGSLTFNLTGALCGTFGAATGLCLAMCTRRWRVLA
ncbi:unnamed protein product [Effrenium voratum]|uniref:Sulfotransferase n=1 Tax=Effrenium voratum TaxID=2562239 RepID=A0AA36MQ41_9DINO|nr:unnamed protein product [Effrenium voratum]CAJ1437796.1 unnamed protein product [Effrenium voratum]